MPSGESSPARLDRESRSAERKTSVEKSSVRFACGNQVLTTERKVTAATQTRDRQTRGALAPGVSDPDSEELRQKIEEQQKKISRAVKRNS
jgi:hypothetical protein